MKKAIFITGIAGSGKSTISRELRFAGQEACDIESDEFGLFMFIRKDTGERFVDYDNADMEKVASASWVCDTEKLKVLLAQQKKEYAFYCGIASNNKELMPLFTMSILLRADPQILSVRLSVREGTDDFANTPEGREALLNQKDEFEQEMIAEGAHVVDANPEPTEVVSKIVSLAINP